MPRREIATGESPETRPCSREMRLRGSTSSITMSPSPPGSPNEHLVDDHPLSSRHFTPRASDPMRLLPPRIRIVARSFGLNRCQRTNSL